MSQPEPSTPKPIIVDRNFAEVPTGEDKHVIMVLLLRAVGGSISFDRADIATVDISTCLINLHRYENPDRFVIALKEPDDQGSV